MRVACKLLFYVANFGVFYQSCANSKFCWFERNSIQSIDFNFKRSVELKLTAFDIAQCQQWIRIMRKWMKGHKQIDDFLPECVIDRRVTCTQRSEAMPVGFIPPPEINSRKIKSQPIRNVVDKNGRNLIWSICTANELNGNRLFVWHGTMSVRTERWTERLANNEEVELKGKWRVRTTTSMRHAVLISISTWYCLPLPVHSPSTCTASATQFNGENYELREFLPAFLMFFALKLRHAILSWHRLNKRRMSERLFETRTHTHTCIDARPTTSFLLRHSWAAPNVVATLNTMYSMNKELSFGSHSDDSNQNSNGFAICFNAHMGKQN